MRRFAMVAALLLVGLGARAQQATLAEVTSGARYPLALKLGQLTGEWRRMTIGGSGDQGAMSGYLGAIMSMMGGGAAATAYYTKCETIVIAGETFVVGYKVQGKAPDFAALMSGSAAGRGGPKVEKLTADTPVSLCLMNMRSAGSISDIRAFDLKSEIAESESMASAVAGAAGETGAGSGTSESNLKQIGTALLMYVQDYDEVLPPMTSSTQLSKVLQPYCKSTAIFTQPGAEKPYQPNPILSKKKLRHITSPATMVMLYELVPASDGSRWAVFLDGHVAKVSESDWPNVKKASKIL